MCMSKPTLSDLLKASTVKRMTEAPGEDFPVVCPPPTAKQMSGLMEKLRPRTDTRVPPLPPAEILAPDVPRETPKKKVSRKRKAYQLKDKCPKTLTGEQIKRWRTAMNITQDKARKLLGMSRTSYIEMEHHGVRSKRTVLALRALMRGLHKSPPYKHESVKPFDTE